MLDHFQKVLDVGDVLDGATATTWNLTRQNELVVMTVSDQNLGVMGEIRDTVWANTSTSLTYDAQLWRLGPEGVRQSLPATGISVSYPSVQSLSEGGFVLAGGRCRRYTGGDSDRNCLVFDDQGALVNSFCVGDAVRDIQIGAQDSLWVSYFDEGAMANRAWSAMVETSGLMKFGLSGNMEWRFPNAISDCYALNVTRDAAWLCYHINFPVARVGRDGTVEHWKNDYRRGCSALAFWGGQVLLVGGYGEEHWMATQVLLKNGRTVKVADFDLDLPRDAPYHLTGRGHFLHYVTAKDWWMVDMRELL